MRIFFGVLGLVLLFVIHASAQTAAVAQPGYVAPALESGQPAPIYGPRPLAAQP